MAKQGSASVLNSLSGVSTITRFTTAKAAEHANVIFPAGLFLMNTDTGVVYIADGTSKLSELAPRVDQVLTQAQKAALDAAFVGGSYALAANGVIVADATGKIDDAAMKFIADGKIKQSYLADFLDADGKILLAALPDSARAGVSFFADYTALQAATDEQKRGFCFVVDASGDATVTAGCASYVYAGGAWVKVSEGESLDIDQSAFVSFETVEGVGAVMYDHTVLLAAPTIDALVTIQAAV